MPYRTIYGQWGVGFSGGCGLRLHSWGGGTNSARLRQEMELVSSANDFLQLSCPPLPAQGFCKLEETMRHTKCLFFHLFPPPQ